MSEKSEKADPKKFPRFGYRTPKEDKVNIDGRMELLFAKANLTEDEYYHITKNDLFIEVVYRGLEYLENSKLDKEQEYFQIEFKDRPRKCSSCKSVKVTAH